MSLFAGETVMQRTLVYTFLTRDYSGGPAGCVVAGRLAYADPNLKVMLIEGWNARSDLIIVLIDCLTGGANNRDDPWVYRPGIYVKNMQRDGVYVGIDLLDTDRKLTSAVETTRLPSMLTLNLRPTSEEGKALYREFWSLCLRLDRGTDAWCRCANILGKMSSD